MRLLAPGVPLVTATLTHAQPSALGHHLLESDCTDPALVRRAASFSWAMQVTRLDASVPFEVKVMIDLEPTASGPGIGVGVQTVGGSGSNSARGAGGHIATRYFVAGATLLGDALFPRECNAVRLADPDLPALVEPLGNAARTGRLEALLRAAPGLLFELFLEAAGGPAYDGAGIGADAEPASTEPRIVVAVNGRPVYAFAALPHVSLWRRLTFSAGTRDLSPIISDDVPEGTPGAASVTALPPILCLQPL